MSPRPYGLSGTIYNEISQSNQSYAEHLLLTGEYTELSFPLHSTPSSSFFGCKAGHDRVMPTLYYDILLADPNLEISVGR